MKSFIAALALTIVPASAIAGVLLPNTYASVYCQARAMGMDDDNATSQAVAESYIRYGDGTPVTVGGVQTSSDVVASYREAKRRCPQYFS